MQAEERASLVQRLRVAANGQIYTDYGRGTRPLAPEARPGRSYISGDDVADAAEELVRLTAIADAARAYREAKAKYVTVFDAPAGEWKQRYVEFEAQYRAAEVALWAVLDCEQKGGE